MFNPTKRIFLNIKVMPRRKAEFLAAMELRGTSMSAPIHDLMTKIIREESDRDPVKFKELTEKHYAKMIADASKKQNPPPDSSSSNPGAQDESNNFLDNDPIWTYNASGDAPELAETQDDSSSRPISLNPSVSDEVQTHDSNRILDDDAAIHVARPNHRKPT